MSEDLNIFYYGGSGGFYFLHQLLTTKKFICIFKAKNNNFKSFNDIKNSMFNISNPNKWKENELFPDNNLTLKFKSNKNKIFYNVNEYDEWLKLPGKKILIYTDLRSQIRLTWYKKAKWFMSKPHNYKNFYYIAKNILKNNKNLYHNSVSDAMQYADITVKFQDLLTPESLKIELKKFNCDISQENIDFLNYYLSLHTPKLLQKIGVGQ